MLQTNHQHSGQDKPRFQRATLKLFVAVALLITLLGPVRTVLACGAYGEFVPTRQLQQWAKQVLSDDAKVAEAAIQGLRKAGPRGLEMLCEHHADLLNAKTQRVMLSQAPKNKLTYDSANQAVLKNRLRRAINMVAGQFDAHASRLYWFDDLKQAQREAVRTGRPILSLHMLGKLTDECSCANSRFFRTLLYANQTISEHLRKNFVLHWHSVRPVPQVTIDFGDGRVLRRTLTGNSIHYVLATDGTPIEAIPGLYGPQAFLKQIKRANELHTAYKRQPQEKRAQFLQDWHRIRGDEVALQWNADLAAVGEKSLARTFQNAQGLNGTFNPQQKNVPPKVVPARAATMIARPKGRVEMPILAGIGLASRDQLEKLTTEPIWRQIAARHRDEVAFDAGTVALMQEHIPVESAMPIAITKSFVETPLMRMVRQLRTNTALDTVQNEYLRHIRIHQWFATGSTGNLAKLNDRVYAEIFLTPRSDPWLGLVAPDSYSALINNGMELSNK